MPRNDIPLGIDKLVLEVLGAELGRHASHAYDILLKDGPILLHDSSLELYLLLLLDHPCLHIVVSDCIGSCSGQQAHLAGCRIVRIDTHGSSTLAFEALFKRDIPPTCGVCLTAHDLLIIHH